MFDLQHCAILERKKERKLGHKQNTHQLELSCTLKWMQYAPNSFDFILNAVAAAAA